MGWCAKHVKDASADLVRNISREPAASAKLRRTMSGNIEYFASCLHAGVFIMRRNAWTLEFLGRTLLLSRITKEEQCGTSKLNPDRFDQCLTSHFNVKQYQQEHVGDQCVVSCDATKNTDVMNHYETFGPNHSPLFQHVILASFYFPRKVFFWRQLDIKEDTFVINCGGDLAHEQLVECVRWAV